MDANGQPQTESEPGKRRIMIIEDDHDLNSLLKFTFEASQNYEVASLYESDGALDAAKQFSPELILLDVMLPGPQDGKEILRHLRKDPQLQQTPVILLTARNQESDRVAGFEAGADDYITKPFSPKELLLRVQAVLRRTQNSQPPPPDTSFEFEERDVPAPSQNKPFAGALYPAQVELNTPEGPILSVGPIEIYTDLYRVLVDGEIISLTSTEYQLLVYLAERAGRLQSRSALLQKVWGYEGNLNTRTVDTHVKRLRQKLGNFGCLIETVHGFGYQLVEKPKKNGRSENLNLASEASL